MDEDYDENTEYALGYDEGYGVGKQEGYNLGIAEHKRMTKVRMMMMFDTYMSTNKFAKAKEVKEMLQFLDWEYDPEKAAKNLAEDADKWF